MNENYKRKDSANIIILLTSSDILSGLNEFINIYN